MATRGGDAATPAVSARNAFDWQLELCLLIDEIARMQRTISGQRMAQFGLTHIQYLALVYVAHHQGMTQTELQRLLEITRGACTQLTDRLARANLLERRPDPRDRRINRLYLSPHADTIMARSRPVSNNVLSEVFRDVPADDAAATIVLLSLCKQRLAALNERNCERR